MHSIIIMAALASDASAGVRKGIRGPFFLALPVLYLCRARCSSRFPQDPFWHVIASRARASAGVGHSGDSYPRRRLRRAAGQCARESQRGPQGTGNWKLPTANGRRSPLHSPGFPRWY